MAPLARSLKHGFPPACVCTGVERDSDKSPRADSVVVSSTSLTGIHRVRHVYILTTARKFLRYRAVLFTRTRAGQIILAPVNLLRANYYSYSPCDQLHL